MQAHVEFAALLVSLVQSEYKPEGGRCVQGEQEKCLGSMRAQSDLGRFLAGNTMSGVTGVT